MRLTNTPPITLAARYQTIGGCKGPTMYADYVRKPDTGFESVRNYTLAARHPFATSVAITWAFTCKRASSQGGRTVNAGEENENVNGELTHQINLKTSKPCWSTKPPKHTNDSRLDGTKPLRKGVV